VKGNLLCLKKLLIYCFMLVSLVNGVLAKLWKIFVVWPDNVTKCAVFQCAVAKNTYVRVLALKMKVEDFFVIKPTGCANFTNLLCH
jgi:hypothetical protein